MPSSSGRARGMALLPWAPLRTPLQLPALLLLLGKTTNILGILQQQLNCIKLLRASEA